MAVVLPQTILLAVIISVVSCILRRLFFHPLRHVPGPKLAAMSGLYGFYHNTFNGGYVKLFPDLHKEHKSPVIRIGPNIVHVNDPEFYQTMFASKTKYRKDPQFYDALDGKGALLSITDDQEYRSYRSHMSPLFSVKFAADAAPTVLSELERMSGYLDKQKAAGMPIDIQLVYRAFVADIGCRALLGHELDFMAFGLETTQFMHATKQLQKASWLVIQFPNAMRLLNYLPDFINNIMAPELMWFNNHCAAWFEKARENRKKGVEASPKRFFDLCLDVHSSSDMNIRDIVSPVADSYNLLAAGMDTTSYTLSCATFYILESPDCTKRLRNELSDAGLSDSESLDLKKIQNLPYLSAVIKEALRLSHGTPGYLPRVVPSGGVHIGSTFISEGAKISTTHPVVQLDPTIFPEPNIFRPERWIDNKDLERWHIGFSKGPRKCIGMNLANLQLYSCLAYIFARYDMQLFETDRKSLEWSDYIVAQTAGPIKIKILSDRWK
ncbi:elymoclavine monooxygenase [Penicillium cf. viridicatum]|uniref:Elymoclavine monooxygenase n=1 Tax=Penicillium cf. viridicatum TaxID=2972119 RepID=A0A9W9M7M8_9EURO|nr:elymoclavine monooxygenase [Penicillium cf. viridicatum]